MNMDIINTIVGILSFIWILVGVTLDAKFFRFVVFCISVLILVRVYNL